MLGGGRTSSKNHVKKFHSILYRYAESSRGCTEIKQVLIASKFAGNQWGSMLGTLLFLT